MRVRRMILQPGLLFAIMLSLMYGSQVAWATAGTTLCDPSTGKGTWVTTQWINYQSSGREVLNWYGNAVHVNSDITSGSIRTILWAKIYCDQYTGLHSNGDRPWSPDPVPTGTVAISPLPQRAAQGECVYCTDQYPYCDHIGVTDGIALMETKSVYEYRCQCDTNAPEVCDGIDNNCNGQVDEGCPTCTDGIKNQGETGVDCGGPCQPCPTCTDGIQNQGETDVDCGGPCGPCCLANISATPLTIHPSSGGNTTIAGGATAIRPLSICGLTIAGITVDCAGSSASLTWNGRDSSGKIVAPGIYPASFGFTATSGCSASKSIDIKVIEGPKGPKICPTPL